MSTRLTPPPPTRDEELDVHIEIHVESDDTRSTATAVIGTAPDQQRSTLCYDATSKLYCVEVSWGGPKPCGTTWPMAFDWWLRDVMITFGQRITARVRPPS